MARKTYALAKGGHVYTVVQHHPEAWEGPRAPRYIGFKDGNRWGAFRSKKEFEQAVDMEPDFLQLDKQAITDQMMWAMVEERLSTWRGNQMAEELLRSQARRRQEERMNARKDMEDLDSQGTPAT